MMTDGTYVRRKGKGKRHPIQYERIESNAEHLDDDDVALAHHDDDDGDEDIAVQFMTPWGPMTMEDEPDGDRQTGAPAMGSGWEFEYNFDIDNFPFHLLPTLAAMNEEEMTDGDGNVTGNPYRGRSNRKNRANGRENEEKRKRRTHQKQQSSTLNVVMEDEVESIRLQGHRDMGKKKRKRRQTTKDSSAFDCGVEESVFDSTEESNLAIKSRSNSLYDEGYGRRDTMPDTIPDPMSPERRSTITADTTEANYMGGSEHDESR